MQADLFDSPLLFGDSVVMLVVTPLELEETSSVVLDWLLEVAPEVEV
jgi:hypothetical protein